MDFSHLKNMAWHRSQFVAGIKIPAISSQLFLFDQSADLTQSEALVGSFVILTTAQLAGLRLKGNYAPIHSSHGLLTHMELVGYLVGVRLFLTKEH